jgi:hypothetical protein
LAGSTEHDLQEAKSLKAEKNSREFFKKSLAVGVARVSEHALVGFGLAAL